MGVVQRVLAMVSALALMHGGWQTDVAGAALIAGLFAYQTVRKV